MVSDRINRIVFASCDKLCRTGHHAGDRFAGAGKVMVRVVSELLTGRYGTLDGLLEAPPLTSTP
jgi:hypothetical protein